jgi:hypothetical protein
MATHVVTTILAVWGAVISTIALAWNIIRDSTDRGRLRVKCYIGNFVGGPGPRDPNDYLIYKITNVGRRPITVTSFGGELKKPDGTKKHFVVIPRSLPKTLHPGEYVLEYAEEPARIAAEAERLTVYDSHDRTYAASRRDLKEIRRAIPLTMP